MSSLIPEPYRVVHVARVLSDTPNEDTGNPVFIDQEPVVRRVQSISQIGHLRGSSKLIMSAEFLKRVETSVHISTPEPTAYSPGDQVLLFADIDEDGNWVTGTGTAYLVDGDPFDGRTSPWPMFTKAFGGLVHLKRVT